MMRYLDEGDALEAEKALNAEKALKKKGRDHIILPFECFDCGCEWWTEAKEWKANHWMWFAEPIIREDGICPNCGKEGVTQTAHWLPYQSHPSID